MKKKEKIECLYIDDMENNLIIGDEIGIWGLEITTKDNLTFNYYTTCVERENLIKLRDHLNKLLEE
jgi:hypothetical protein